MPVTDWYRWDQDVLTLRLRVQPRAGRTAFAEPLADTLKVKLKAPPVDGRANAELVRYLADAFGVTRSEVEVVSGRRARTKQIRIHAPKHLPLGIRGPDA